MIAFAKLPKDVQRAALAVTHLADVTLAEVIKAVTNARSRPEWHNGSGVTHYCWQIQVAVEMAQRNARPTGKVVSLEAWRAAKEEANG